MLSIRFEMKSKIQKKITKNAVLLLTMKRFHGNKLNRHLSNTLTFNSKH